MPTLNALQGPAGPRLTRDGRPWRSRRIASTGAVGRAIVPSGASTGRHEALELRDVE